MKLKLAIEVGSKTEGDAIKWALADPEIRGFVIVVGALLPCTPQTRTRIIQYVADKLAEERGAEKAAGR